MTIAGWRGGDGDDGRAENLTPFGEAAVGGEEHRFWLIVLSQKISVDS
jgi:hypothetical protein